MSDTPLPSTEDVYPSEFFRRQDETADELFYQEPRLLVHIDEPAIAAVGDYLGQALPGDSVILDLMSSWRSHLPEGFDKKALVGVGLNAVELAENPQLDECVVHNINLDPVLPFEDEGFDAAIVSVSIQYITRPLEVFRDVRRVLKPGAAFHVIYSNRMFSTKAVAVWQNLDDKQRTDLIGSYFVNSGGWDTPKAVDASPVTKQLHGPHIRCLCTSVGLILLGPGASTGVRTLQSRRSPVLVRLHRCVTSAQG